MTRRGQMGFILSWSSCFFYLKLWNFCFAFSTPFASFLSLRSSQGKTIPWCKGQWPSLEWTKIRCSLWQLMQQCRLAMEVNVITLFFFACCYKSNFPRRRMRYKVQLLQDQLYLEENYCSDVLVMFLCRIPIKDSMSCMSCISLLTHRTSSALNL